MTHLADLLTTAGITTELFGTEGISILHIGNWHPHDGNPYDERSELAAGPARWDEQHQRWQSARGDFCVGPDSGTGPDDGADFWYPTPEQDEQQIAAQITDMLAQVRAQH